MRLDLRLALFFLAAAVATSVRLGQPACAAAGPVSEIQSFDGNTGWLNSPALRLNDVRGKVVLVDFWEYTCINCLRTLPYLRAWWDRYHNDGFVIVGVHTSEFGFSGETSNVQGALQRLGIQWPVVLDTNNVIWNRYQTNAWPTEYLFDQRGQLRETHAGEGGYPQTEALIQSLLKASNPSLRLPPVMALLPQDSYDKPGAVCYPETPETFVGPWHGSVANEPASHPQKGDTDYSDSAGGSHQPGAVYLKGYWHATPGGQAMVSGGNDGYLSLGYQAIQVMAVMRPDSGSPIEVGVTQDGKPVAQKDAGKDIRYDAGGNSYVEVDTPRAYELINNASFGQHELRLFPRHYGAAIYSFAFESCQVPGT